MRIRNNLLVLDTETVGDFGSPIVHDIGWSIEVNGQVVKNIRHLVKNIRDNQSLLNQSEFYQTKKDLYDLDLKENKVDVIYWKDIIDELKADIKKYGVKVVCAYNVGFDYRALNNTQKMLNNGDNYFEKLLDKNMFLCIWNMACDKLMNTKEYKNWALENQYISDKGNYLTNAECCYRYLTGNKEFEERHTSLEDVQIETEILNYLIKNCKGKADYGLKYGCWQKVQE